MTPSPIYLDYNATTPVDPRVADAMKPYLTGYFGNPSSGHFFGRSCREGIETARGQLAGLLGCRPSEVVFTSGGTESNNAVILGVAESKGEAGCHIITSAVEHPAVLEPCRFLEARRGVRVTVVPVDETGRVDPADVERALTPQTILVTVMHANNEVGTLQPIAEIAAAAHAHGALVHTDAAQSAGKVPVRMEELGIDFLSVAGHKLYGPKGIGALVVREGVAPPKILLGASQEHGRRAGTENVLEIVGLGAAAAIAHRELEAGMEHSRRLRDRLWAALESRIDGIRLNGHPVERLPNTLSVGIPGLDAGPFLVALGDRVAASAGSACHAGSVEISAVLRAMKVPEAEARGTVRLSVGRMTTAAEVDQAAEILARAAAETRR